MKARCPVNTGPEDCKPVMFFTTPNNGRFGACVCKLKNTAQSRIKNTTRHSIEQEVRHKVLSAVHLSVCAVRHVDKKAEKDKTKYNKLNHCFFPTKSKKKSRSS